MGKSQYPAVSEHRGNIRIRFTFAGKRYGPVLPWAFTPSNQAKASKLCIEVKGLIKAGVITHKLLGEYFPDLIETEETTSETPIFSEIAQTFLNTCKVSINTRNEYKKSLNKYWMPEFAPVPINQILPSELKAAIAAVDWTSGKTRNNAVSVIRRVFELALDDELIDSNPADKVKSAKHQKQPPDPFSEDEAESIIADLYRQHHGREVVYAAYFEFAFWTGMRTSEMLALTWGDIDWNQKTVRVCKAQSKGRLNDRTKTAKARDVMLTAQALHALSVMKPLTYIGQGQIFKSPRTGDPWMTDKSPRAPFYASLRRNGVRQRKAYNTRHTYATILLMRGVNPAFAAAQLGHSLQVFLQVYAKWIHGDQNKSEFEKIQNGHDLATESAAKTKSR
jgi:integrase